MQSTIKAFVRRAVNVHNQSVPVIVVDDTHGPVVVGQEGGHFTRGGTRISHPSGYARRGWSNMVYHTDNRRIYVGQRWIDRQIARLLRLA